MAIQLGRLQPKMPPQAYKSYSVRRPVGPDYWRTATCAECGCKDYLGGWVTQIETHSELGQKRFHFITHDKTRRHVMQQVGPGLYLFTFGPGQTCYRAGQHRVRIDRPPLLLVAEGDWRGNPRRIPARVHQTAEDWVDDFATHQETLARAVKEG